MYRTGVFVKGDSFLYNLDPRLKLAVTVLFSLFILWVNPQVALITGIVLLCLAPAGGIKLRTIGQAVKPLLFFIVLIFLVHLIFDKGESLVEIPFPGFSFSREGLQQGFLVVWRFLCLIVMAVLLTMTTPPSQMIAAIKYFLKPLKVLRVPVDDVAVMMMLALRLMPILLTEKERIDVARKARGYDLKRSGYIPRLKAFLSLTLTILLGVFRRADEIALAMESRSYRRGERSSFVELKLTPSDYLALIFSGVLIIIFVALNSHFG
ncbi:MAG: energy-coupling factor transporter transmembrane protein EcfT [Deltaproteobacteria bacterium]|nr:energy-coupling factor transporter transmembrane protein EcfT [Deltaproteobacteria bacterium]